MKSEFWLERWQQNQIGFHQQQINAHLQEFWPKIEIPNDGTVFVPLCGKSRDMLWLRAQGYKVLGIEISPIAVADFFKENRLDPRITESGPFQRWETDGLSILCGDFFDLQAKDLKHCEGVFDRASLIALPPEMRSRYAKHMMRMLPQAARFLLVTMEYAQEEMAGPPFSVHEDEVRTLYQSCYDICVLFEKDILTENPRFIAQGLSSLLEKVYRLSPDRQS
jgi:thiopurine S-methyltransferase